MFRSILLAISVAFQPLGPIIVARPYVVQRATGPAGAMWAHEFAWAAPPRHGTKPLDCRAAAVLGLGIALLALVRPVDRARFMTGVGYRLLASANIGELVLGCIEAKFCK